MRRRVVAVVGYPGAESLDISSVTATLDAATRLGADPGYRVRLVSPGGDDVACQDGLTLRADVALERVTGPLDTLLVSGGLGHEAAAGDARLVGHVRRLARVSRRVASVCTGASVLAAAGLLDGRRATTHWAFAARLAAEHPAVRVDPDPIYLRDGPVATAAGVTSALDLTLAFVAEDHGGALAQRVARALVTYRHRPGNQAQMSVFTAPRAPEHRPARVLVEHVTAHLDGDLSTRALARAVGVSERHLSRLCLTHLGVTPGRFVRRARTEAAAALLASSTLPVARVATRCGFGSAEALRQAFEARYGASPSAYRAAHSGADGDTRSAAPTG